MSVNKVLIAGSGAIGLRTALECLRSNLRVVLMSATNPLHPSTCSMGSGGLWMPFRCDDMRVVEWSKETLSELLTLANDDSIQNGSSVEIVPTLVLKTTNAVEGRDLNQNSLPKWTSDHRLKFQHMTLEMLNWQNLVHQLRIPPIEILQEAGYPYCWHFHAPIVNGPNMLQRMLDEISSHDRVEHIELDMGNNKFKSIEDMVSSAKHHGCDAVINCTGVGSMSICNDNDLHGARGIIHQYDRSSVSRLYEGRYDAAILTDEGSWGNETEPCYMVRYFEGNFYDEIYRCIHHNNFNYRSPEEIKYS